MYWKMKKGKILVVDEDAANLASACKSLDAAGYETTPCKSGEEVLKLLEKQRVDLIIMDIALFGMDGFETCRRIRKRFPIDDLPVIFLTAKEDEASVMNGFRSGGSDFVCRHFFPEILLARVNVHIRMAQTLRKIREMSLTDDLTQTYNRRHALFTLREWFSRCKRYGTHFALIYIDLNAFKQVNDLFGHQAGDMFLCSVVAAVRKVLRESDMLFRMGGDEFMILCPNTEKEGANICVDRMSLEVSKIAIASRMASFAYGVVHSSDDYGSVDDMLHAADDAMYLCKSRMETQR